MLNKKKVLFKPNPLQQVDIQRITTTVNKRYSTTKTLLKTMLLTAAKQPVQKKIKAVEKVIKATDTFRTQKLWALNMTGQEK